jgi:hypothetical protein
MKRSRSPGFWERLRVLRKRDIAPGEARLTRIRVGSADIRVAAAC